MTIKMNPDIEYANDVLKKIKENSGYCPCKLQKTPDTKCMCKEFRDMLNSSARGVCHCGLYIIEED